MSITDELRKYAGEAVKRPDYMAGLTFDLERIADRIDEEHQKALDEWKAEHGQMWLKGYGECHAELLEGNETLASDLERCGWIRLPLDADGVPIRVGDVMENLREDLEPKLHHRFKVYGIQYRDYGQVCTLTEDGFPSILYRANECRHHTPTVEDVLREFSCTLMGKREFDGDVAEAISEYAKRLTLAGDAE